MGKHSDIQPMFPHLTGLWFFLGSCPICPVIYGQMLLAVSINHLPFEPLGRFNPFLITTLRRHADFDSTLEARQEPIVCDPTVTDTSLSLPRPFALERNSAN